MLKFEIFLSFWLPVFFLTLVSPVQESAMLRRKIYSSNMSFCDPQIEGIPRSASIIEFPIRCNSLFAENTRLNSFILASIRNLLIVKEYYF